jgi:hypothetical protein
VIVGSYSADNPLGLISWGAKYEMTWAFWDAFVDECYGLVDSDWVDIKGTTPAGLTLTQIEEQVGPFLAG